LWEPLHKKNIINFSVDDERAIFEMSTSLYYGSGLKATEYGKLLHFISPLGIAMWDTKWVRGEYQLEEEMTGL
jgi:hypothetical protein